MRNFSWYTDKVPHYSTYLNGAPKKRYLVLDGIDVVGRAVMHYKPNRKGGHRHNHIRNAHKRMRKCHICEEHIVTGCEVISDWTNAEFMCRECCRNDAEDYCSAVGINFGGVSFQTRRRRK